MTQRPFFRFSMDETAFHKFFSTAEDRFRHYDELVARQDEKIQNLSTQVSRLQKPNGESNRQSQFEGRLLDMQAAIDRLESELRSIAELCESLNEKIQKLDENFKCNLSSSQKEVEVQRGKDFAAIREEFTTYLGGAVDLIGTNKREVDALRAEIDGKLASEAGKRQVVAEMATLNRSQIESLPPQIESLSSEIRSLASEIHSISDHNSEDQGTLRAEIEKFRNEWRLFPVQPPEPDLDSLSLRPEPSVDFDAPPRLPKLRKFVKVAHAVGYLYELVPVLQSILTCMHRKFSDPPKLDAALAEIRSGIVELEATIQGLATREELSMLMKRRTLVRESESLGGLVKCLACGRGLPSFDAADEDVPCQRRVASARRMTVGIVGSPTSARSLQRPHVRRATPK
jgi:predicted  nucleic acid-binding Zn-ribbon protein